ncbi:MAG: Ig-like domain-containing protein [Ruminococcus sp.]|nr:Ig-like domain-containing protein [Ruminococcus sp.]
MKTTKKLVVLCLIAVMAIVAVMPSTFSWYAHNGTDHYQGNEIDYVPSRESQFTGDGTTTEYSLGKNITGIKYVTVNGTPKSSSDYSFDSSSGKLTFNSAPASGANIIIRYNHSIPLSLKQSSGLTMTTYKADKNGKQDGGAINSFDNITAGKTQRYITKIKNNGANPVSLDLEMSNITNDSKVSVGVCSPVINEKSYASRAAVNKVDWDYEIIYFEPRTHYDWWKEGVNYNAPTNAYGGGVTYDDSANTVTPTNDMNLCYTVGGTGHYMPMQKCPNKDIVTAGSEEYDVYRAFVTTEADDLFFFNHYYVVEDTNKEWNRTPSVSDFYEGRTYYLNGSTNNYNNKDLSYHDSFTETNLCVYYYYNTATMSVGKTADIGLSKGTKEMVDNAESFDYLGASISYSSSDTTTATVSQDGLITAKKSGNCTITTTITGEFGDTIELETAVSIPETISQVPIAQNINLAATGDEDGKDEIEIVWYVKNGKASGTASFDNIFYTI